MDQNMERLRQLRIERTVKALCDNHFDAHFVPGRDALLAKVGGYLSAGASCSVGGSVTLKELGLLDYLKGGGYNYLDRYAEGINPHDVFHQAMTCDVYFTSTNAVTEDGCLYNVDGNGNRVAALIYGPKKVIVVCGANKIVRDVEAAHERMETIAAPANNIRLEKPNPCTKLGRCAHCNSETRICSTEVVSRKQVQKDRVAVLILPDSYGY